MKDGLHRRWQEVRTMLTDWLAWLDETQRWVETTAVAAPSSEPLASSGSGEELAAPSVPEATHVSDAAVSRADLSTLFEAMTALRQEVNLQTRSARRDREQASATLDTLSTVVDQLSREAEEEDVSEDVDTVHVDVLLELHDALWRAERQASQVITTTIETLQNWGKRQEIETATDSFTEELSEQPQTPLPEVESGTFGRLRRWFIGSPAPAVDTSVDMYAPTDDAATAENVQAWVEIGAESERMANRLGGLMTGYQLSLQRMERILSTCGIEPISCLGQAVDPELMEVVQIVSDSTKSPGMVTDEVRCGYRRYGRVYRFAQVVATRSDATPSHTHAAPPTDGQAS